MSYNAIGVVTDAFTGSPINNVSVIDATNPENSAVTDESGTFALSVEDDVTLITFTAAGYVSRSIDSGDVGQGAVTLTSTSATPGQQIVISAKANIVLIIVLIIIVVILVKYKNSLSQLLK